jgi:cysteinyl-tRNA synthetase
MTHETIRMYNTLTRSIDEIVPLDGSTIRMYTCGPTVYDVAHIGNFRTFLFEDVLRKTLQLFDYKVFQVMNLTDVDDKTIKGSRTKGIPLAEYTSQYKKAFFEDLDTLKIERAERYPEATAYIKQMIDMVQALLDRGAAYVHSDGSVYFAINKAKDYGKLSHLNLEELEHGASKRIAGDEYSKEGISDFVLWKAYDKDRDGPVFWESPWGKGRPGWHLECSVMARDLLGDTIDIHAGGVDLIFPHHENEIAQSETCTGKPFAKHWVHAEHLLVEHKKMSKSLGNFYTLRDLIALGFDPIAIRFFLISNHYRTQLNFTLQSLEASLTSIKRIRDCVQRLVDEVSDVPSDESFTSSVSDCERRFLSSLADDLNTNEALAAVFDCVRIVNHHVDIQGISVADASYIRKFFLRFDSVFGILLTEQEALPEKIARLLNDRLQARKEKNWKLSDLLRDEISREGYRLEDLPEGQRISKNSTRES